LAIRLVHTGHVDLRVEEDFGLLCGVLFAGLDSQEVDAPVIRSVGGTHDRAVPEGKGLVVGLVQAVRHRLVGELTLLTFFKLLVEPECSWHYIIC